jgi:DNA-binding MarR family transcriptional regulator
MTVNSENLVSVIHQTHDMIRSCEDKVFGEQGLTTEQYSVLAAIKYLDEPVRITDLAHQLTRSTNSVSMLVDRMVRASLLNRVRDEIDRRTVFVSMTSKAETLLEPAILAEQEFIQEILSPLSYEEKQALLSPLLKVQHEASEYLNSREPLRSK